MQRRRLAERACTEVQPSIASWGPGSWTHSHVRASRLDHRVDITRRRLALTTPWELEVQHLLLNLGPQLPNLDPSRRLNFGILIGSISYRQKGYFFVGFEHLFEPTWGTPHNGQIWTPPGSSIFTF